jgi:glycerol-3-phosphate cytidylyltransferase
MRKTRRIMVDMSVTLLHHGHIRILKKASELGSVIVALTSDEDVEKAKGYKPEMSFNERREILESIRYVDEVVVSPWLIDDSFLDDHDIDLLVHGNDNRNPVRMERLLIFARTEGISSTLLRKKVLDAVAQKLLSSE